jgi:deazaflavin-dependent oxidoreductase (nitroreductase family)
MAGSQEFDNNDIVAEFRENDGVVGGLFAGQPIMLVHHVGRRSNAQRINPLTYQRLSDGWAVFGTNGGSTKDPDWCLNVLAQPDITIEVGSDRHEVRATLAHGVERTAIWEKQKVALPVFVQCEAEARREIPVIILRERVS